MLRDSKELAQLHPGMFFGERALLSGEPASATIKAIVELPARSPLVCYTLDRATFNQLLGPLSQLLSEVVNNRDSGKPPPILFEELSLERILVRSRPLVD